MSEPKTLQEAIIYYSDPDNCLRKMVSKRWPNGVVCPNLRQSEASVSTLNGALGNADRTIHAASSPQRLGPSLRIAPSALTSGSLQCG